MARLVSVVETPTYLARIEKLTTEDERIKIVDAVARAPLSGVLIKGTGGLRKMRIGLEGRGKRGGGRVVYWFHSPGYPVVLMWALAKNASDDLTNEQRDRIAKVAARLLDDFGGSR